MKAEAMKSYESSYVQPRSRKSRLLLALIGIAVLIVIAIVIAGGSMAFAVRPVRIEGQAMRPTLKPNDKVLMLKRFGELQRGDIVVFLYPRDQSKSFIKRIVGLPGETIDIKKGKVIIDGKPLDEPYIHAKYVSFDTMPLPLVIPTDQYVVLGDNRKNSCESRSWGTVPRNLIYGKYWYRYWSASRE